MVKSIKGAERRTVVVRTTDSGIFETAYFLLRCGAEEGIKYGDMVSEALKIINDVTFEAETRQNRRRNKLKLIFWMIVSAAVGAGAAVFVLMLLK